MLYKIGFIDVPLIGREILVAMGEHSARTRQAKFSRLSQALQKAIGKKGKVKSLSIILEKGEVSIGLDMEDGKMIPAPQASSVVVEDPIYAIDIHKDRNGTLWAPLREHERTNENEIMCRGVYFDEGLFFTTPTMQLMPRTFLTPTADTIKGARSSFYRR